MATGNDTPVVIPAKFWDEIEKHVRLSQGLAETLLMLCGTGYSPRAGLHDLLGLAEALEEHTGEVFSMVTDPGRLQDWEREQRARRRAPMLQVVE